jgi:hypothetical protein
MTITHHTFRRTTPKAARDCCSAWMDQCRRGSRRMSDMGIACRKYASPGSSLDMDASRSSPSTSTARLTIRDSFTEFLRWRAGPGAWALGLVKLAPAAGRLRQGSRPGPDQGGVRQGIPAWREPADAGNGSRSLRRIEIWPRFMRPDALEVWNDWGQRGAHRVIVTASPDDDRCALRPQTGRRGPAGH